MESAEPLTIFIRNAKGLVWGPLAPETVELLIDSGIVEGKLEASLDGLDFKPPHSFPELREFFQNGPTPAAAATAPAPVPAVKPAAPMAGPGALASARSRPASGTAAPAGVPILTPAPIAPAAAPVIPAAPARPAGPPPGATSGPSAAPPTTAPEQSVNVPQPPGSGDLAQQSPLHLYYLAASGNHTGLLRFQLSDRTVGVHFRKGNPEHVSSDHGDDALGPFLLKQGTVTQAQLTQAEGALTQFGGELSAALFGLGLLNPSAAFPVMAQRSQALLLRAIAAEGGSFTFVYQELESHKVMPLGNRWAVLADAVRRIPATDLQRRLRDVWDLPVMRAGGFVAAEDVRLAPREAKALTFIDGVRSLSRLCADMPAEQETFLRVGFLLRHLELISFAAVRTAPPPPAQPQVTPPKPAPAVATPASKSAAPAAAKSPAASRMTPAPGSPPAHAPPQPLKPATPAPKPATPAPQLTPEQELVLLRASGEKLPKQNLFEVLGLTEKADGAAVKAAYLKLAKAYHPDTIQAGSSPELVKLKSDLFTAVGNAYHRLSDDASRADYLDELKTGSKAMDVAAIFAAEDLFQRGSVLVKARKFPEAVTTLDEAIKANPEEGEFYAWRGFARFFIVKDKAQGIQAAMQDLQLALKKNERCAQAHYFRGVLAKLTGDNTQALRAFKATLDLQPEHVDAQREVRMLSGKR